VPITIYDIYELEIDDILLLRSAACRGNVRTPWQSYPYILLRIMPLWIMGLMGLENRWLWVVICTSHLLSPWDSPRASVLLGDILSQESQSSTRNINCFCCPVFRVSNPAAYSVQWLSFIANLFGWSFSFFSYSAWGIQFHPPKMFYENEVNLFYFLNTILHDLFFPHFFPTISCAFRSLVLCFCPISFRWNIATQVQLFRPYCYRYGVFI